MRLGDAIKRKRDALGISQVVAARQIGVAIAGLRSYEYGLSVPRKTVQVRLKKWLDVSMQEMFDLCAEQSRVQLGIPFNTNSRIEALEYRVTKLEKLLGDMGKDG